MNINPKKVIPAACAGAAVAANCVQASLFRPEKVEKAELPPENVDLERYKRVLSEAIRCKTISTVEPEDTDWSEFDKLHKLIEESYPLIHSKLKKEVIGRANLVYFWEGKNPELDPIALIGHQDVVPIASGTLDDWTHPPFDAVEADGYIWGRGALDMKNHAIGVLESVETLLEEGYEPERSIYLLFGENEEIVASEHSGAHLIAEELKKRGVHLDSLLDEGGEIIPLKVPGVINKDLVGVGIAEKGYADFMITVTGKGGHSSAPPVHSSLGKLAKAIEKIENNQFKAELNPIMDGMLDQLFVNVSYGVRLLTCHKSIMKPLMLQVMKQLPESASFVRSTTAVTMASASPQANVLPKKSTATVNLRLMPGTTIADAGEHLRKCVGKGVEVELLGGNEPSIVSPTDTLTYDTIGSLCGSMFEKTMVIPYIVMGGTDARNYQNLTDNVYRFSPFKMTMEIVMLSHGTDERIPVSSFEGGIAFFKRYIKALAG